MDQRSTRHWELGRMPFWSFSQGRFINLLLSHSVVFPVPLRSNQSSSLLFYYATQSMGLKTCGHATSKFCHHLRQNCKKALRISSGLLGLFGTLQNNRYFERILELAIVPLLASSLDIFTKRRKTSQFSTVLSRLAYSLYSSTP